MIIGGVKFKNVVDLFHASPDNPIANAFAGKKANDAAVVLENDNFIIIIKGNQKQRIKRQKAIRKDIVKALDVFF